MSKVYVELELLEQAFESAEASDIELFGVHISECFPAKRATEIARSVPVANVVERKYGEWILGHVEPGCFTPGGNRPWICSECGQVVSWHLDKPKKKFCEECGSDMRGGYDGKVSL